MAFEFGGTGDLYTANNSETQALLDYAREERAKFEQECELRENVDAMSFLDGASAEQRHDVFFNLSSIMFTNGCNGNCDICLVDAKPGITKQISTESAEEFISEHHQTPGLLYRERIGVVPYYRSDLLDHPDAFKISEMIRRGAGDPAWNEMNVKQYNYTHLPPHAIEPLLKHMTEHIIGMVKDFLDDKDLDPRKTPDFIVSVVNNNEERATKLRRVVTDSVLNNTAIMAQWAECSPTELMSLINYLLDTYCFAPRNNGYKLSDHGRHYPGDHVPVEELNIPLPCKEGVMLTPDGIVSNIYVLPTNDNPTGALELPFAGTGKVFRRSEEFTHDGILMKLLQGESPEIVLSSLRNSIVGGPEGVPASILTPRNELLREAQCWNEYMRLDKIFKRKRDSSMSLVYAMSQDSPAGLEKFGQRIVEAYQILQRTGNSDPRAAAYLKRTLDRIMNEPLSLLF
ncbi:hypothetical protein FWF74_02425 [Candidatus Saccharibacteria bacterium]|nr:hypothetical protein [Candidatus Saccharibacteria bacterium]MCL1962968.1 hypothetical protein [Candidatus Saccharibacteria bacterium]